MWQCLEYIASESDDKILKDDPKSWRNFWSLYPLHSMLLKHYSIGHAQFIWDLIKIQKL